MTLSRSENMARIRRASTRPEVLLRHAAWAAGLRYRVDAPTPAGRADLILSGGKIAVFLDGCFWHGCPDHYVRPRTRATFWASKLRENVLRDRRQTIELEKLGWRVCRVWEHDIPGRLPEAVSMLALARSDEVWLPPLQWRVVQVDPIDASGNLERRFIEDLRDPERRRVAEQVRHTRKQGRVLT